MQIDLNEEFDSHKDLIDALGMASSRTWAKSSAAYHQPSTAKLNQNHKALAQRCRNFLQQTPAQRLDTLQQLGLARYDFLIKMRLSDRNIAAIMRFLARPEQTKFPQLQNTELSGLNLNQANLIRANLTAAQLVNTSLVDADLIFANFTAANLTDANLTGATLNQTVWQDTVVTNCHLGSGIGLSTSLKLDLQTRGAILTT
jgi:uncharacterized protein YjbI with pentapeptide repeats